MPLFDRHACQQLLRSTQASNAPSTLAPLLPGRYDGSVR